MNDTPAFPLATSSGSNTEVNGMTLRDYFAAKAMAAILSNGVVMKNAIDLRVDVRQMAHASAAEAYLIADAMLEEAS